MARTLWPVVALAMLGGQTCTADPSPAQAPAQAQEPPPPPPSTTRVTAPKGPPLRKDGTIYADTELMGTRVSINVWVGESARIGDRAADAAAAVRHAFDEMARLEQILSEWRPSSELSQLSDAAGGPARPLSPELLEILLDARRIAADTDGSFDPTFHGVGQLWHFTADAKPPPAAEIDAKLSLVDWRDLELDPKAGTARLRRAGMKLGLGAIGKGYAADKASARLTELGFAHHVVEVGGDTYASGTKHGQPWMVGIQRPGTRGVVGVLPMHDGAVVTSGDYQRFFEHQGQRYAHILDPRTGWPIPAERSPQSVTVVAARATDADAYCTAVAVMGVEAGMALVEQRVGLEAVIITQSDEVRVSSGLQDVLIYPPQAPEPSTL